MFVRSADMFQMEFCRSNARSVARVGSNLAGLSEEKEKGRLGGEACSELGKQAPGEGRVKER